MQSSVASKLPLLLARRSMASRRLSLSLGGPPKSRGTCFCPGTQGVAQKLREQQQEQPREQPCPPPRRIHSTLASKSFWRGLHQAVRQGNGNHAEEIAEEVLRDFYRLSESLPVSAPKAQAPHDYRGSLSLPLPVGPGSHLLDSRVFSLVLRAWQNSDHGSLHSALRAHNLLVQMAALADQDVLCDPPTQGDYLAVLECWHRASEVASEDGKAASSDACANSAALAAKHAEELWGQMEERQRMDAMAGKEGGFSIGEEASERFASLLARAGRASRAEQVVWEAVAKQKQKQLRDRETHHRREGHERAPSYSFPDAVDASGANKSNSNNSSSSNNSSNNNSKTHTQNQTENETENHHENQPMVGLDLCHAVLRAHIASKESRASERAEAFLRQMAADPSLPGPTVDSYNLVLERWMRSSRATRKPGLLADIAGRVEELIHHMKDESRIQPDLVSYKNGIDALARSGEAVRAETMLAHLVKDYLLHYDADLKPGIEPFQSVLWAYSKAATGGKGHRRIPDAAARAESILGNMKELSAMLDTYPTVWSYNTVLKCLAHSGKADAGARALALYEDIAGASPGSEQPTGSGNNDNYNHEDEDKHLSPRPIDLGPDAVTVNTVLSVLAKGPDAAVRTEEQLWAFCEAHEQDPASCPRPDAVAFSTAIHAWSRSADADAPHRAEALLQKLIDRNQHSDTPCRKKDSPDVVTYTNLMQCWIKSKKPEAPEKSESILRELQAMALGGDKRMAPDAACWNSVISAWAAVGNGDRAEALFLEMLEASSRDGAARGASPTSITLTNVLKAWVRDRSPGASDRAVALLEKMEDSYRSGALDAKPNTVNYTVAMDCLAYAKTPASAERAEAMLRKMEASGDPGMRPSLVSYNSAIKAWSYSGDPEAAGRITGLLRELIDRSEDDPGMRPSDNTFGTILRFLAESDLPDKKQRAVALKNLMDIFLESEPKPWVKHELERCLSATGTEGSTPLGGSNARSTPEREIPPGVKDPQPEPRGIAAPTRERRANKRFQSEIRHRNLASRPVSGPKESPDTGLRDALVRVRLVRDTAASAGDPGCGGDPRPVTLVVVDGESEYSCLLAGGETNPAKGIKGGQFLDISYYWHKGDPVVVEARDAVTGHGIKV